MIDTEQVEREVLRMLLSGDFELLNQLRCQIGRIVERDIQMTGAGFVASYKLDDDVTPAGDGRTFRLGDVDGEAAEVPDGLGFVLFVREGLVSSLEGYVYDGVWPVQFDSIKLTYRSEPRKLAIQEV